MLTLIRDRTTRTGILVIYGFGLPFLLAAPAILPNLIVAGLIVSDLAAWACISWRDWYRERRRQAQVDAEVQRLTEERARVYREYTDRHIAGVLSRMDPAIIHRDKD